MPTVERVITYSSDELARLFNEWMRCFIEEPEKFAGEWQNIKDFLEEDDGIYEPSYGQVCVAYLSELAKEMFPQ